MLVQAKTVNVATAGTLNQYITTDEKLTTTELVVTGQLNGDDMRLLREMAGVDYNDNATTGKLATLDLSQARIVAGGSSYKGSLMTKNNVVGESMFSKCSSLVTVKLPKTVTSIETDAFSDCSAMTSIVLPDSLKEMGDAVFVATGLVSITIPEGITRIGDFMFYYSESLATVNFPASLTQIGEEAFSGCPLTTINVAPGSRTFYTEDGVLYTADKTKLLLYPQGRTTATFTMPAAVRTIGSASCKEAQFAHVVMNSGLTTIEDYAFDGCAQLQSIDMPSTVTKVGPFAFNKCTAATSTTISAGLKSLPESMYAQCQKLNNVVVPDNVENIGLTAFSNCKSLTSITLPARLDTLGDLAFNGCIALTTIQLPQHVSSLGKGLFYGCKKLESVTMPTGIDSIPYRMFYGCNSLKEFEVPQGVTTIVMYAFQGSGLEKVTIPQSCTYIGDAAFMYCTKLAEIQNYNATPQELGMFTFEQVPASCVLYVPKGAAPAYRAADTWKEFTDTRERETTAVNGPVAASAVEVARYNAMGQRLQAAQPGVNIVVMSDGSVHKSLVR